MPNRNQTEQIQNTNWATALLFVGGAIITSIFSASLVRMAAHAALADVLIAGMIIPSFTWLVHLTASAIGLAGEQRRAYWYALGKTCWLGSLALLPAALVNLLAAYPPLWVSIANVLASVALMGAYLYRAARRCGLSCVWPISWCLTIAANMAIFTWWSWRWW